MLNMRSRVRAVYYQNSRGNRPDLIAIFMVLCDVSAVAASEHQHEEVPKAQSSLALSTMYRNSVLK